MRDASQMKTTLSLTSSNPGSSESQALGKNTELVDVSGGQISPQESCSTGCNSSPS